MTGKSSTPVSVVLVTVPSMEEAKRLVDLLLNEKLAACVSIIPQIVSQYGWEGKRESSHEVLLIIKTATKKLSGMIPYIRKHHSYQVPEILALPVLEGNSDYLKWVEKEVSIP